MKAVDYEKCGSVEDFIGMAVRELESHRANEVMIRGIDEEIERLNERRAKLVKDGPPLFLQSEWVTFMGQKINELFNERNPVEVL